MGVSRVRIARKRPFRISRGISTETENLFVTVAEGSHTGLGEMAPIGYGDPQTAERAERELAAVADDLAAFEPWQLGAIEALCLERGISSAARAALDIACHDWLGKRAGLSLFMLLGLSRGGPPTSITVGIVPPEDVPELVTEGLETVRSGIVKMKLGGPDGVEADRARFIAARQAAHSATIRVDANGGWAAEDAVEMMNWLREQGCEYVEQPVHYEDLDGLRYTFQRRSMPILLDENVQVAQDVVAYASLCDGVNVKLMKTGGIGGALRVVHTARSFGLRTMIGCMSESSVGISAGAAIAGLFDYVDLDSNLNMLPDPASGAQLVDGRVVPTDLPGIGAALL